MAPTRRSDSSSPSPEPNRLKVPEVGLSSPSSKPIVVVLPEPVGPVTKIIPSEALSVV